MSNPIACSTSAWRSSLEEALRQIAALGFRQADLLCIPQWGHIGGDALADRFEAEAARVEAALAATGIRPSALNCAVAPHLYLREDGAACARRLQIVEGLARLMVRLGVARASFYPGYRSDGRMLGELLFDWVDTFREMSAVAARHGVEFLVEPHWQTPFDNLDACHVLFEAMPEIRVAYDPSHFLCAGIPLEATAFLLERAGHVHVRDAAPGQLHAPRGRGTLDFGRFAAMLRASGYTGPVTIECLPMKEGDVAADVAALREHLVGAGLGGQ